MAFPFLQFEPVETQKMNNQKDNPLLICSYEFLSPPCTHVKNEDDIEDLQQCLKDGPDHLSEMLATLTIKKKNITIMYSYQQASIEMSGNVVYDIRFHPEYPYLRPSKIAYPLYFRKEAYCMLYYMLDLYTLAFTFHLPKLRTLVSKCQSWKYLWQYKFFASFLELFMPLDQWKSVIAALIATHGDVWALVTMRREFSTQLQVKPKEMVSKVEWIKFGSKNFQYLFAKDINKYKSFVSMTCLVNGVMPDVVAGIINGLPVLDKYFPPNYEHNIQGASTAQNEKWISSYLASSDSDLADE